MIDTLVFDLDDTLYREADFVASGYRSVARHLALNYGCSEHQVRSVMMTTFARYGRERVFSTIRERFLDSSVPVSELVEAYRAHEPSIGLYSGTREVLETLSRNFRLGIITDGLPEVQKRKVMALNLGTTIDSVIYTWEYGPEKEKPHPYCFSLMLNALKSEPGRSLFVGDNLRKDCRGAHSAGMRFVLMSRVQSEERKTRPDPEELPDYTIRSLEELPPLLQLQGCHETV